MDLLKKFVSRKLGVTGAGFATVGYSLYEVVSKSDSDPLTIVVGFASMAIMQIFYVLSQGKVDAVTALSELESSEGSDDLRESLLDAISMVLKKPAPKRKKNKKKK